MEPLTRAVFEVPNWLGGKAAELEVVCQQERLLLVTLRYNGRSEAILYTNTVIQGLEDLERACRLAIRQLEPLKSVLNRSTRTAPKAIPLEMDVAQYDGILMLRVG
jgi:hypothetical protein